MDEQKIGARHSLREGPEPRMIELNEDLGGTAAFGPTWSHGAQRTGVVLMTRDEAREVMLALGRIFDLDEGAVLIATERNRQIEQEGYDERHDDGHADGELADAAACYAATEPIYTLQNDTDAFVFVDAWPWDHGEDKRLRMSPSGYLDPNPRVTPTPGRIRELVKAGALIAAEIDRLLRMERDAAERARS